MSVSLLLDHVRHDMRSSSFLCPLVHTNVSTGGIKAWFVCLPAHLSLHAVCLGRHWEVYKVRRPLSSAKQFLNTCP